MLCKNHNKEIAIEKCNSCGHWYCDDCVKIIDNKAICNHCLGEVTPNKETEKEKEIYKSDNYLENHKKEVHENAEKMNFSKGNIKNETIEMQKKIVEETAKSRAVYKVGSNSGVNAATNRYVTYQSLAVERHKLKKKIIAFGVLCFLPPLYFVTFIMFIILVVDGLKYKSNLEYYNSNR
ncbi:MAG: hypothetical protein ACK5LT_12130 [Lachnospirales bacterium]